jgi:hypothetical protein
MQYQDFLSWLRGLQREARRQYHDALSWARTLHRDERWRKNAKISSVLWTLNFILLYIGITKFAHNGLFVNIGLSLFWDGIWYFINRYHLWKGRRISTSRSARHTLWTWGVTFALNNACFWLLVSTFELQLFVAKPLLTMVSFCLGTVRYGINDKLTFAPEQDQEADIAESPGVQKRSGPSAELHLYSYLFIIGHVVVDVTTLGRHAGWLTRTKHIINIIHQYFTGLSTICLPYDALLFHHIHQA